MATQQETKDNVITAEEFLRQQERLEEDAKEILPYNFDKCSYDRGYLKQAVYACKTCTPVEGNEMAGICYSCSIACHADHDLVELFTKRNFRCDCGTTRIIDGKCSLQKQSIDNRNDLNRYNHNFKGRFCWCKIDYDPEKEESEMFQCLVCEDWFHDKCIGKMPDPDLWDAFICRDCVDVFPYLKNYIGHSKFLTNNSKCVKEDMETNGLDINVELSNGKRKLEDNADDDKEHNCKLPKAEPNGKSPESKELRNIESVQERSNEKSAHPEISGKECDVNLASEESCNEIPVDIITGQGSNNNITKDDDMSEEKVSTVCIYEMLPKLLEDQLKERVDLFLPDDYQELFCKCENCKEIIKEKYYYLYQEETIYSPEEDPDLPVDTFEAGLQALGRMDRIKAIEGLCAYDKMKQDVISFLRPFAEQGKEVSESDIRTFFQTRGSIMKH